MIERKLKRGLRLAKFKETKILIYDQFSKNIYEMLKPIYEKSRKKLIPIEGEFDLNFDGYIPIGTEEVVAYMYKSFFEDIPFNKKLVYDNPAVFVRYKDFNMEMPMLFGNASFFVKKLIERREKTVYASLRSLLDLIDLI